MFGSTQIILPGASRLALPHMLTTQVYQVRVKMIRLMIIV
jgi:hypothetical protein